MDKKLEQLGKESLPFVELKRLRTERQKLEGVPGPSREKVSLEAWRLEKEKELRSQMESVASSVVSEAEKSIESLWNEGLLKEEAWKFFVKDPSNRMWPYIQIQYLSLLQKQLETSIYERQLKGWNARTEPIDRHIQKWEEKIPGDFKPGLINVDARFPVDRCNQIDGKWCDKWLTDSLKSKPIFFEPKGKWIERLNEFYEKVYCPLFQREEEEALAKSKVPPVVKKVEQEYQPETKLPLNEMLEHGFFSPPEEETFQERNVSRIYRGGKG